MATTVCVNLQFCVHLLLASSVNEAQHVHLCTQKLSLRATSDMLRLQEY
jgi:hypothetical protein